jgi:hypothetical protein
MMTTMKTEPTERGRKMKRWMIAAIVAAVALALVGRWASAEEVRPVSEVVAEATAQPAADPVVEPSAEIPAAPAVVPAPAVVAAPTSAIEVEDGKVTIDLPMWWAAAMNGIEALAKWGWQIAFTFLGGYLIKRIKDTKAAADATASLEAGINGAWVTLGKTWKAAHEDGKFTSEEKAKLRAAAYKGAKDIATGAGLKILKAWGQEFLEAKISGIVEKRKAVARKS